MNREQGNSAFGMVLLVLSLGALTLYSSQQQLAANMSLLADQRQFSLGFWQAQSALQWGVSLAWPIQPGWQCRNEAALGLQICLLRGERDGWLQAKSRDSGQRLWQRVNLQGRAVHPLPHGWIDFCPFSREEQCEPAAATGF